MEQSKKQETGWISKNSFVHSTKHAHTFFHLLASLPGGFNRRESLTQNGDQPRRNAQGDSVVHNVDYSEISWEILRIVLLYLLHSISQSASFHEGLCHCAVIRSRLEFLPVECRNGESTWRKWHEWLNPRLFRHRRIVAAFCPSLNPVFIDYRPSYRLSTTRQNTSHWRVL